PFLVRVVCESLQELVATTHSPPVVAARCGAEPGQGIDDLHVKGDRLPEERLVRDRRSNSSLLVEDVRRDPAQVHDVEADPVEIGCPRGRDRDHLLDGGLTDSVHARDELRVCQPLVPAATRREKSDCDREQDELRASHAATAPYARPGSPARRASVSISFIARRSRPWAAPGPTSSPVTIFSRACQVTGRRMIANVARGNLSSATFAPQPPEAIGSSARRTAR